MERPILFSAPMVQAILEGRKSMTRRVVECPCEIDRLSSNEDFRRSSPHPLAEDNSGLYHYVVTSGGLPVGIPCPYGVPGDHLYVKEAWRTAPGYDPYSPSQIDPGAPVLWLADGTKRLNGPDEWGRYRHSRFMPWWASRLTLEITDVRVERLQEISQSDVKAEGIKGDYYPDVAAEDPHSARIYFMDLWDSINAKKHPWESNPWVWVISFKRP